MADAVRRLLDRTLRVELTDGRVLVGTFTCFDKQRNLLLTETRESRVVPGTGDAPDRAERHIGLVLVPRKWVNSCHVLEAGEA